MSRDSKPLAVFHCLAAPAVGSGHVVRCLTLADALRVRGWRVGFAADAESRRTACLLYTSQQRQSTGLLALFQALAAARPADRLGRPGATAAAARE